MKLMGLSAFLLIEFMDEIVQGLTNAAWPAIRSDLSLSYMQVGLLLWLPRLCASLLEPGLFVLADTRHRSTIVMVGALGFSAAMMATGTAGGFAVLLAAFMVFSPSSGAFVSVSQASMVDADPAAGERSMALWTAAGAAGNLVGPLAITAAAAAGLGWRPAFFVVGAAVLPIWYLSRRAARGIVVRDAPHAPESAARQTIQAPGEAPQEGRPGGGAGGELLRGLQEALRAFRDREILRALVLLEAADFMGDILSGFLALYLVGAAGFSYTMAGAAMTAWTAAFMIGNLVIVPVLHRFDGLRMVRLRALILLAVYPAFLLTPVPALKIGLLVIMGLLSADWYPVLMARLFQALPEKSGTAQAVNSAFGTLSGAIPFALGLAADAFGISFSMWLILSGVVVVALAARSGRGW